MAVRSTTPGSGKGLLVDAVSVSATGRCAPRFPQVLDEDEERKRLFALALAGDTCGYIDNVTHPLGSPALDMALTSRTYSDRILGTHETQTAPWNVVLFASGNNLDFCGDTARRVVPIDLDPQMERPEERTDFIHDPLLPWVQQEHPTLLVAALTLLQAYFKAGCPKQGLTPFGSFQEWSDLVRSCLVWAGEVDPCDGRKDLAVNSDPEYRKLAALLVCWPECYPVKSGESPSRAVNDPPEWPAVTLKRVAQDINLYAAVPPASANSWNELRDALGAFDPRYDGQRLNLTAIGNKLRTVEGRVRDRRRLVRAGQDRTKALEWRIETMPI